MPNAQNIFQKALYGDDPNAAKKLDADMKAGKLGLNEIKKVIDYMADPKNQKSLDRLMNTPLTQIQRMKNQARLFIEELNNAGAADAIVNVVKDLTFYLKQATEWVSTHQEEVKDFFWNLQLNIRILINYLRRVAPYWKEIAEVFIASKVIGWIGALMGAWRVFKMISAEVGIIRGGLMLMGASQVALGATAVAGEAAIVTGGAVAGAAATGGGVLAGITVTAVATFVGAVFGVLGIAWILKSLEDYHNSQKDHSEDSVLTGSTKTVDGQSKTLVQKKWSTDREWVDSSDPRAITAQNRLLLGQAARDAHNEGKIAGTSSSNMDNIKNMMEVPYNPFTNDFNPFLMDSSKNKSNIPPSIAKIEVNVTAPAGVTDGASWGKSVGDAINASLVNYPMTQK